MVEMMIVIAIFTFLVLAGYSLFQVVQEGVSTNAAKLAIQKDLRRMVNDMVKEIREGTTANIKVPDPVYTDSISFQTPATLDSSGKVATWNSVRFELGSSTLIRTAANNPNVVTYRFTVNGSVQRYLNEVADARVLASDVNTVEVKYDQSLGKIYTIKVSATKNDIKGRSILLTVDTNLTMRNPAS